MPHRITSHAARALRLGLAAALLGAGAPALAEAENGAEDAGAATDPALYQAPREGGVRRWRVAPGGDLALRKAREDDAPLLSELPEGALLRNLGCAAQNDRLWCAVRPFRGGARGYVDGARLEPAAGPRGDTPRGPDDSRRRARLGDYDAKGRIACAQEVGQALGPCAVAVARSGGGDATAVVTFPNGFARQLYFAQGEFISASATMSGAGRDTSWRVEAGAHHIRVDDQRFVAPAALIFGE